MWILSINCRPIYGADENIKNNIGFIQIVVLIWLKPCTWTKKNVPSAKADGNWLMMYSYFLEIRYFIALFTKSYGLFFSNRLVLFVNFLNDILYLHLSHLPYFADSINFIPHSLILPHFLLPYFCLSKNNC